MSASSASPPTERPVGVDRPALERLIGVRSSKPSFYAAWRDKSDRLDHTIGTLERISSALCAAPAGPVAVCDAVVEAAAHHFDARWAAMVFAGEHAGVGMARVFVHASHSVIQRWEVPPQMLQSLTDKTLAVQRPVLADHAEGLEFGGEAQDGRDIVNTERGDGEQGARASVRGGRDSSGQRDARWLRYGFDGCHGGLRL